MRTEQASQCGWAVKAEILPVTKARPGADQDSSQRARRPRLTLSSPKNLSGPSLSLSNCSKVSRQRAGTSKGNSPSMTSTSASACHNELLSKAGADQRRGGLGWAWPAPEPRMARKNSEEGSTTTRSEFLLKLAL